ncbi:MAG: thioredoxin family protein [Armatimonadota bacterium]|nr:thioredoxin family protein [bacterium]
MIQTITWRLSLEEARMEARERNRQILIDLYNPTLVGSRYMQEHTYTDPRVHRFVDEFVIPVRFDLKEDPGALIRYHAFWTPCIILSDIDDNEHRRSYGVLSVEQFLAEFWVGYGLLLLNTRRVNEAIDVLERARIYTAVDSVRNAENHYWLGVAKYQVTGDIKELEYEWQKLRADHPSSDWARKTDYYFD